MKTQDKKTFNLSELASISGDPRTVVATIIGYGYWKPEAKKPPNRGIKWKLTHRDVNAYLTMRALQKAGVSYKVSAKFVSNPNWKPGDKFILSPNIGLLYKYYETLP